MGATNADGTPNYTKIQKYGNPDSDAVNWTGTQVHVGNLIKKARISTLASEIGQERVRRGKAADTVSIGTTPKLTEINALASYAATANVTNPIKASDINRIIGANVDRGHVCLCNCNYCTCNCNYACTCDCNYSDERLKTNIIFL
jgi:hypothetical protein